MGRPRSFDTAEVVAAARDAFVRLGYRGASMDDLLRATGIQRASLYQAFGSKCGLLLAALDAAGDADLDLALVALMDLAADDPEVAERTGRTVERLGGGAADALGEAVLRRASAYTTDDSTTDGRNYP